MKKLSELMARLAALKAKGAGIVKAAEDEDRELTVEEATECDAIVTEAGEVAAEIEALQAREDMRRRIDAVAADGAPTAPAPTPTPVGGQIPQRAYGHNVVAYGRNMVHDLDPVATGGFKDIAEFAVSVREACGPGGAVDPRLMAAPTNQHEGGGSGGEGFSLPPAYRDTVFEVMETADDLGPLVDEETTSARRVEMSADETTPWGSTGVQANWRSEGAQMSASKMADSNRSVVLHELYAFVLATGELLDDAPRMASRLTNRAGQALAYKKNEAMIWGTGAGQPLGWMNAAALITVAKESGQAADTITAANVLNMYARLGVVQGDTPRWFTNRNCLPQLAVMTIGDQPVWQPGNNLANAPGGFLLGYPVSFSEFAETLGDLGDLMLASPRGYYSIVRDTSPQFARSIHLYFDYNIEAFRWMTRIGGQPHLSAPIDAPTRGGGSANSKSHFVTLAERA